MTTKQENMTPVDFRKKWIDQIRDYSGEQSFDQYFGIQRADWELNPFGVAVKVLHPHDLATIYVGGKGWRITTTLTKNVLDEFWDKWVGLDDPYGLLTSVSSFSEFADLLEKKYGFAEEKSITPLVDEQDFKDAWIQALRDYCGVYSNDEAGYGRSSGDVFRLNHFGVAMEVLFGIGSLTIGQYGYLRPTLENEDTLNKYLEYWNLSVPDLYCTNREDVIRVLSEPLEHKEWTRKEFFIAWADALRRYHWKGEPYTMNNTLFGHVRDGVQELNMWGVGVNVFYSVQNEWFTIHADRVDGGKIYFEDFWEIVGKGLLSDQLDEQKDFLGVADLLEKEVCVTDEEETTDEDITDNIVQPRCSIEEFKEAWIAALRAHTKPMVPNDFGYGREFYSRGPALTAFGIALTLLFDEDALVLGSGNTLVPGHESFEDTLYEYIEYHDIDLDALREVTGPAASFRIISAGYTPKPSAEKKLDDPESFPVRWFYIVSSGNELQAMNTSLGATIRTGSSETYYPGQWVTVNDTWTTNVEEAYRP